MEKKWRVTVFLTDITGRVPVYPTQRATFLDRLNELNPQPLSITWEVERKVVDSSAYNPTGVSRRKVVHTALFCEVIAATQFLALMQIRNLYEKAFGEYSPKSNEERLDIDLADFTAEEILDGETKP